jgi:hypothetical protein
MDCTRWHWAEKLGGIDQADNREPQPNEQTVNLAPRAGRVSDRQLLLGSDE